VIRRLIFRTVEQTVFIVHKNVPKGHGGYVKILVYGKPLSALTHHAITNLGEQNEQQSIVQRNVGK
jgi:hypothetical protein